ncbi:hypothetical protein BaRGS_00005155, partial [Batillaria attramentaria]
IIPFNCPFPDIHATTVFKRFPVSLREPVDTPGLGREEGLSITAQRKDGGLKEFDSVTCVCDSVWKTLWLVNKRSLMLLLLLSHSATPIYCQFSERQVGLSVTDRSPFGKVHHHAAFHVSHEPYTTGNGAARVL